jgi:cysteinyl-tRNA synthetase
LPPAAADPSVVAQFRDAMDDDLDTPKAMALLFDTVRRANAAIDHGDSATAAALAAAVGEICTAVGLVLGGTSDVPDDVVARARALDAARAAKDYAAADALRRALQADGWIVETTRDGTQVRR